jgi:hypothetical protein
MTKPAPDDKSSGFLQHHDDEGFLDALQLLLSSNRVKTAEDLIHYAERAKEQAAADFLRALGADDLPVQLMFEALAVHVRIVAHKRNNRLLRDCAHKKVGLVLPLPRHVLDAFLSLPNLTLLIPDGHSVPPALRSRQLPEHKGTRASRNASPQMEVLVFEAHRDGERYLVDPGVSDVVDLRLVPTTTELVVHVRPHPNPDDIPVTTGAGHTLNLL